MVRVTLVRHGQPTAGWRDDAVDPGLDPTGTAQAVALADVLAPLGPIPIVVSPLRRTRETAAPLERLWGTAALVLEAVGEIRSPTKVPAERTEWLRGVLDGGLWRDFDTERQAWRAGVLGALESLKTDTVVVTHFVAINTAVAAATNDDRVVCFKPGHCSRTVLEIDDDGAGGRALRLVSLGDEAATVVR